MGYGSAAPTGVPTTLGAPKKNIGGCHYKTISSHYVNKDGNSFQ